jgi:hypothetical protein
MSKIAALMRGEAESAVDPDPGIMTDQCTTCVEQVQSHHSCVLILQGVCTES